jgi:hypothetical protein
MVLAGLIENRIIDIRELDNRKWATRIGESHICVFIPNQHWKTWNSLLCIIWVGMNFMKLMNGPKTSC